MKRYFQWVRQHIGLAVALIVSGMAILGVVIFARAFRECHFGPAAGATWQYHLTTEIFAIDADGTVGACEARSQHKMDLLCLNNDNDLALITVQQKGQQQIQEEISHLQISPKGQVSRYDNEELLNNSGQSVGHFFDFNLFPLPEEREQSWTVPMVYSILPPQKNQVLANVKRIQNGSHPKFLLTFPPVAWVKRGPSDPYSQISDFRCEYVFDTGRGVVQESNISFVFARERPYPQAIQQVQVRMALSLEDWQQFEDPVALRDTAMKTMQVQAALNAEHSERVRNILQHFPHQKGMHPALQKYLQAVNAQLNGPQRSSLARPIQSERTPIQSPTTGGTLNLRTVAVTTTPIVSNASTATTASAGKTALQIASVPKARKAAAEQEVAKLKGQGFQAFLDERSRYLVICIGPFAQRDEKVLAEFKRRYPHNQPFWITLK